MSNPGEQECFKANREMWDERADIHAASRFYDLDGFRNGAYGMRQFEVEELGSVQGKSLVHLQCHIGTDTLCWSRRGARVTGLDFSPAAIKQAAALAESCDIDARFVTGNVYEAPKLLGERYDIVYTGLGAICWLPDLTRWARVIADLVKPGGTVYIVEFHPFIDVFADEDQRVQYSYFNDGTPRRWEDSGTYTDRDADTTHNVCYDWVHPISDVIQSLLHVGLTLELIREHRTTVYQRWPFIERRGHDDYRLPEGMPSLPFMYSLRLRAK